MRWIPRLLVVLTAALVAETAVAKTQAIIVPPVGDDIEVAVQRGTAKQITLKAYEGKGRPLAYEVISEPKHGQLSDFIQADENQQGFASVVYTHSNEEVSTQDSFRFKTKAVLGGGVSREIKVKIVITDAAPLLGAPDIVRMNAVAGESANQKIGLTNAGGGVLRGSLDVREPLFLEGGSQFNLGRGQSTNVILRFSPKTAGSSIQKKVLRVNGAAADMELRTEATAPFTVQANDQQLQLLDQDSRGTKIRLLNLSSQPQTVNAFVEPQDSALIKPTFSVPRGGSEEIEVTVPAAKKGGAFDFALVFTNALYAERLELHVPAVPARLELRTPAIDFGRKRKVTLIMANTGGAEGRFNLVLPPGIRPDERAESFSVEAGETKEVHLSLDPKLQQTTLPDVLVEVADHTPMRVPVVFQAPTLPNTPTPTPTATPPPNQWPWVLNTDIRAERTSSGDASIAWSTKSHSFSATRLQVIRNGQNGPYQPQSAEGQGWWDWLTSLPQMGMDYVFNFFNSLIRHPEPEIGEDGTNEQQQVKIPAVDATDNALRWFLEAKPARSQTFEQVSEIFALDATNAKLIQKKPISPESTSAPIVLPPGWRTIEKQTPIEAAEPIKSTRTSALLVLYLAPDTNNQPASYRLERRTQAYAVNVVTGQILRDKDQILQNEFTTETKGNGGTLVQAKPARLGNKDYTRVEARIEGLNPGTRTYWRIVPVAGGRDLAPTAEIAVCTQPPWQFPWRYAFLTAAGALLAWVLYLRWKLSRPSG